VPIIESRSKKVAAMISIDTASEYSLKLAYEQSVHKHAREILNILGKEVYLG
jgi:hypothetical protein